MEFYVTVIVSLLDQYILSIYYCCTVLTVMTVNPAGTFVPLTSVALKTSTCMITLKRKSGCSSLMI